MGSRQTLVVDGGCTLQSLAKTAHSQALLWFPFTVRGEPRKQDLIFSQDEKKKLELVLFIYVLNNLKALTITYLF